ncbi:ORC2-domain-containing protein [Calocera viscosa TUFC12733]|uniref:Origin recognition complex subunit 2 n=1 Tax=Calocera viscosa (strain TUFC12733) TaxID=1330018 RepID=A0A167LNF1_CALVF|nr:ORC2-domain-containing protein [Calocera viscosa TUFC12733]
MARTPHKRTQQAQSGTPTKRARTTRSSVTTAVEADWGEEDAERARALLRSGREEREDEEEDEEMANAEELEEEEEDEEDDSDEDEEELPSPTKSRGKRTPRKKRRSPSPVKYQVASSADAYFFAHSSKHAPKPASAAQKSFSSLPQLSAHQMQEQLSKPHVAGKHTAQLERLRETHRKRFPRWVFELEQGFNLLWYGFGSKLELLDAFAREVCAKRGHVALLHGYLPSISHTSVMASLLSLPFVPTEPAPPPPSSPAALDMLYHALSMSKRPLFILVHSLDTTGFLTTQMRAVLTLLALHPKCHLVATVDKINAPLLFTQRDLFTRKHDPLDYSSAMKDDGEHPPIPPQRGFGFTWQEVTTFENYTAELAPRASALSGGAAGAGGVNGAHLDLTATIHILNSVPDKSKTLFTLLGKMQLESLASPAEDEGAGLPPGAPKHAAALSHLLTQAREAFIATNEVQFRAQLAEFRDHGLVGGAGSGAQEVLWVNVNKSVLQNVLRVLEEDG